MKSPLQLFNDRTIQFKLGFVLLIPLMLLVYVTMEYLLLERDRQLQAELNVATFQFIVKLDHAAHNLALERRLSAGFIASRGQQQQLELQRKKTNQQLSELYQDLEQGEKSKVIFEHHEVVEFKLLLQKLDDIRAQIDREEIGKQALHNSFQFFSKANARLLYLIQESVSNVSQLGLAKQSRALYALLGIKERAGQERGRLNSFFSSGKVSINASIEINHYIHDQQVKLEEFFHHATTEHAKHYRDHIALMEEESLRSYRELFLSRMEKQEKLEKLRGLLGFGGMIHNFKNYVIRGSDGSLQKFEQNYSQVVKLLMQYRALKGMSAEELRLLDIVEQNVNAYHKNLQLISNGLANNLSIAEVDRKVKVDDAPALKALNQLSLLTGVDATVWFDLSSARIQQIEQLADKISAELLFTSRVNQTEITERFNFYKNGLLLVLLLTIVLALYVWKQFSKSIGHTLGVIYHAKESGDISSRVTVFNQDEIGAIGSAINEMFNTYQRLIHEAIAVLDSVAGGRFEQRISTECRGDLQDLKQGVNKAVDRIKQSTEAKDEFLASMSHELRTPLTAIIGNSEYLLEQDTDSARQKVLYDIESAGRSQLALVNDILDMSKIESGKFSVENIPYDLSQLLNEIKSMLSIRVRDAGLELLVEQKNSEAHKLVGDRQRIGQILINLLSNAIKFTDTGSITLTAQVDADHLLFEVKDSGIGMAPAVQERLFQRFEQADGSISRRFGGSGLGLYISLNLAELMGGTITVSSQEGVGSVFKLILPYLQSDQLVDSVDPSGLSESLLDENISGNVLVAEDTPELQMLERRILESMGLTVTIVENGKEAVDLATSHPFDLILMDMQMPVMDGIEATQTLREQNNQTPIVALTANVMQKHREKFEQAGCTGFLGKPIDKAELRKILREQIQQDQPQIKRIVWRKEYSVGSALMDQQHQVLIGYINQMVDCYADIGSLSSQQRILKILPEFHQYVATHFKDEEMLLSEIGYPDLGAHLVVHERYGDRVASYYQSTMDEAQVRSLVQLLMNWWNQHVLVEDMAYKEYLNEPKSLEEATSTPPSVSLSGQAEEEVDDELMMIFFDSATKNRDKLIAALSNKDWREVRSVAHSVKGSAVSFGYPELSKMAETVQTAIDEENMEQVPVLVMDLIIEMGAVLPAAVDGS